MLIKMLQFYHGKQNGGQPWAAGELHEIDAQPGADLVARGFAYAVDGPLTEPVTGVTEPVTKRRRSKPE